MQIGQEDRSVEETILRGCVEKSSRAKAEACREVRGRARVYLQLDKKEDDAKDGRRNELRDGATV